MRTLQYTSEQIYARPELVEVLKKLTMGLNGELCDLIKKQHKGTYFLVWKNSKVIAQCFVQQRTVDASLQVNIYVDSKYRRMGIGKRLAFKAKLFGKQKRRKMYYGASIYYKFEELYSNLGFIDNYEYSWN